MELLIPNSFKTFGLEYEAEEIEKCSAAIIIENVKQKYGNVSHITFVFDPSDMYSYDNYVFYIHVKHISFETFEIAFPVDVIISVSNNNKRRMSNNCCRVIYSTKYETFRNDEGEIIKYYPYSFE